MCAAPSAPSSAWPTQPAKDLPDVRRRPKQAHAAGTAHLAALRCPRHLLPPGRPDPRPRPHHAPDAQGRTRAGQPLLQPPAAALIQATGSNEQIDAARHRLQALSVQASIGRVELTPHPRRAPSRHADDLLGRGLARLGRSRHRDRLLTCRRARPRGIDRPHARWPGPDDRHPCRAPRGAPGVAAPRIPAGDGVAAARAEAARSSRCMLPSTSVKDAPCRSATIIGGSSYTDAIHVMGTPLGSHAAASSSNRVPRGGSSTKRSSSRSRSAPSRSAEIPVRPFSADPTPVRYEPETSVPLAASSACQMPAPTLRRPDRLEARQARAVATEAGSRAYTGP